ADLQGLLDDRTLLLEFSLGEAGSYVWAVTRDGIHSARLAPRARIVEAVRADYDRIAGHPSRRGPRADHGAAAAAGAELAGLLLAPVSSHLDRERVAIVADGSLQYVAFASLPEPSGGGGTARAPEPMVARHEVVFLPSATALGKLRTIAAASPGARA